MKHRVLVAMLFTGTAWTFFAERACCCRRLRYRGNSGRQLLAASISAFDPEPDIRPGFLHNKKSPSQSRGPFKSLREKAISIWRRPGRRNGSSHVR